MSQETNKQYARSRRRRRSGGTGRAASFALLYIACVIGVSVVLACLCWIAANDVLALNKPEHSAAVVLSEDYFTIRTKTGDDGSTKTTYTAKMGKVADLLEENQLVDHPFLFRLFSSFTGGKTKLRPGAYHLDTSMDYRSLIAGMGSNSDNRVVVEVTIPEGYTVQQTFQLLESNGVASAQALMEYAANYNYGFSFLQDIPLGDANRLEGFLFPDTYEFYVNHDPKYVINKLLQTFDLYYTDEMRQQVAASKYSLREYLTVASLIERETDGTDRGEIASVIYNRLEHPNSSAGTNGYLQIDATLYYLTGHTPTEADKAIDSPYNTYKYPGLPPTPIANPGLASLKAALKPENTGYYYYALGDSGKHKFFQDYNSMLNWMHTQKLYKK